MKEIIIKGYNNLNLYTRIYDNCKEPKAIVQIIHGMKEHSGRYDRFAKMLEKNNYIVFASDSRGHGKTALSKDLLGHGEKDIFDEVVKDQTIISEYIKNNYNLPLFIFAHSWGSMIAQEYLQSCHLADKVILCGTNNGNNGTYKLGKFVTNIQKFFGLYNKPAKFIDNTNKKLFANKFENGNWLSRDNKIFDKFLEDPLCNALPPVSFYNSLFKHMTKVNKGIKNIRKDVKLFLIAGDNDPVGNFSKNVLKLTQIYKKHNLNVSCKIYPGARHELINEINKEEVDKDILEFFNK